MAATPEILQAESPHVVEHAEEFPETIQQSTGAQVVQKTFKAQVIGDSGQPLIKTPPSQVITTVQIPSDLETLAKQAKGPIDDTKTWFARLWLRIVERANFLGWKIIGKPE